MARKLVVEIVGDASSLEKSYKRAAKDTSVFGREIGKATRGTIAGSGAFRGLGRSIAFASAGFLGGFGLTAAIRSAFDEMSNAQKVAAQTNAAIKSTGAVAGVSAKHVEELGVQLLNLSGVDDEVIKGSENLLLTFTKIRNVAGKNNDIFDQAAKSALDLSVRFNKDLPSATVTLAKALQDPIRGLTALTRSGVQFDAQTRKQIKTLVESGHLLEAQKVILAEVRRESGGAAKALGDTLAGNLNKVKENVRNLAGAIAAVLLPQLTRLVDKAVKWLQNSENQKAVIDRVTAAARTLGNVISKTADIGQAIAGAVGGWKNAIAGLVGAWAGFKLAGIASAQAVLFANVLAAEGTAAAWKAALISTGFGALAVAAGIAAALVIAHWEKVELWFEQFWIDLKIGAIKTALDVAEPFSHLPMHAGQWARDLKKEWGNNLDGLRADAAATRAALDALDQRGPKPPAGARGPITAADVAARARGAAPPPSGTVAAGGTASERRSRLRQAREAARQAVVDRAVFATERAAVTKNLQDDLASLGKLQVLLKRRIAGGHDTLALERQLFEVQQQIADVVKQQAERRKAARDARQFKLLGFGPAGEDLIPGVKNLRRQLDSVRDAIAGSFLDTRKTRGLLGHIRQVLSGGLGSVSADVRSKVQQILADLKDQLRQSSVDVTRFQKTARGQFTLAGAHPQGGVVINGGVHLHGIQDVKALENAIAKRAKQRAHARRSTR